MTKKERKLLSKADEPVLPYPEVDPGEWVSISDAAKRLEVHEVTFRRWVAEGKVTVQRRYEPVRVMVSLKWLNEAAKERSAREIEVIEATGHV